MFSKVEAREWPKNDFFVLIYPRYIKSNTFYILPGCNCDSIGSTRMSCSDTGVCECKSNFVGDKCSQCAPERYNYPTCEECNCNPDGVTENFFAKGGCESVAPGELCECKDAVTGRICDTCKPLYWNLRQNNPTGCDERFA